MLLEGCRCLCSSGKDTPPIRLLYYRLRWEQGGVCLQFPATSPLASSLGAVPTHRRHAPQRGKRCSVRGDLPMRVRGATPLLSSKRMAPPITLLQIQSLFKNWQVNLSCTCLRHPPVLMLLSSSVKFKQKWSGHHLPGLECSWPSHPSACLRCRVNFSFNS